MSDPAPLPDAGMNELVERLHAYSKARQGSLIVDEAAAEITRLREELRDADTREHMRAAETDSAVETCDSLRSQLSTARTQLREAVEAERETCAKIADELAAKYFPQTQARRNLDRRYGQEAVAAAIRARSVREAKGEGE